MNQTMSLSSWGGGRQVFAHDNDDDCNRVMHNYHDHSMDMMDDPYALEQVNLSMMSSQRRSDDDNTAILQHQHSDAFPVKVHIMLSQAENDDMVNIVSWQPHGRCFVVHDPKSFQQDIMPRYFKAHQYSSFQRQLNLYGFKRITAGPDKGGYYHELFLKHRLFLTHRIHRYTLKGTKCRKAASPETEPNFYKMPYMTAIDEAATRRAALLVGNQRNSSTQSNILDLVAAGQTSLTSAACLPPSSDVVQSAHISRVALSNSGTPIGDLIGHDGASGPDFIRQASPTPTNAPCLPSPSQLSGISLNNSRALEDLSRRMQKVSAGSSGLSEVQPTTRQPSCTREHPKETCAIVEQRQQQCLASAASASEAIPPLNNVEATTANAASVISSLPAHLQLTYMKTMLAMERARKNATGTPSTNHNGSFITTSLPVIPIATASSTTTTTRTTTSNNNNNALSPAHYNLTAPRLYYQVVNQPNTNTHTPTFQSVLQEECDDNNETDDDADEKEFDIILSSLRNMPVTVDLEEKDDLSLINNRYMGNLLQKITK